MNHKIEMQAIGYIHTKYDMRNGTPPQGAEAEDSRGEIHMREEFVEGIQSFEEGARVTVLFHFHKSKGYELITTPYMSDVPAGVFSTRSPDRPNGIGITQVIITAVEKNKICFVGADMLDGTPVLDIKPSL